MIRSALSETRRETIHGGSMPASFRQLLLRCSTSCIHAVVRATVSDRAKQIISLELTRQW
ncbi:MAG: hypothetical protein GXP22_05475 [Gammaproteobacteria bacterium]|nr:hypothetical protein [Gammaproteobacteria bacterium]